MKGENAREGGGEGGERTGEEERRKGENCIFLSTNLDIITEVLEKIFEEAGYKTIETRYDTRELRNRKRKISMYR